MKWSATATRDLPEPVGVASKTCLPAISSRRASSWAGYSVSPVVCTQVRKRSSRTSGSDVGAVGRSAASGAEEGIVRAAHATTSRRRACPEWQRGRGSGRVVASAVTEFRLTIEKTDGGARAGVLQTREDVLDGFERVPEAFLRMMAGRNFGKQLVRL